MVKRMVALWRKGDMSTGKQMDSKHHRHPARLKHAPLTIQPHTVVIVRLQHH